MTGAPTLVDRLAQSAAAYPGREAVVTRHARMTYDALWAAVRRGVAGLAGHGVATGDRVALLASPTPDVVAAFYAVLASGAVIVPLDPDATPYELAGRVAHADPRLVIADDPARAALALAGAARETALITPGELVRAGRRAGNPARLASSDLAAILYTSGTTDRPKGVMLTHGNVAANALAVADYLGLGPDDRILSPLPLFYAYGGSVLHTHLAVGGCVVLADMVFAERTVERMAEERVTGFSGVPWMFTTLLDRTSFPARAWPALRYLTQAGARMTPAEIARLTRAFPHVAVFIMYGQTEATSRLTYLPPTEIARRFESVGRPIADTRIEIRRPDGSVAGPHEAGEVVADGPGVMAGYWRAPDATRAAFWSDDRGRWLRTGDRGSLDSDGFLYLDGRLSDLIKVGGHRVSPAEIEDVARMLPGVARAVAIGAPDAVLGEVVHLVVVRAPDGGVSDAAILAHCRRHLSAYKTPRRVTFTDHLPETASGKIQRARLARALEA